MNQSDTDLVPRQFADLYLCIFGNGPLICENKTMYDFNKQVLRLKHESGPDSVHYPVLYEGFPEEFRRISERELNETDENRKRGLQRLKDFMKKENITFLEDTVLLAILRNCKFNFKKSEAKLKHFLTKRREVIKMLEEVDLDRIESIIDDFCFGILPYRDKHGRAIMYTRPYGLNLERYEVHDVGVMIAVAALFLLQYPISHVSGYSYFGECKSPSLYLFYPILRTFKQIMFYLFSFPIRISRVEILNENYLVRCFHKVVSPVIGKKILSRISLHGMGYDNLHKLYNPDILPEEFGGTMGQLSNNAYKEKLLAFIQDLKNESA